MANKKKITLIQLPHDEPPVGGKRSYRAPQVFPVGVASLAAVLRQKGHEVTVVDCWAFPDRFERLASLVSETRPDLVGISALSTQYSYAKKAAAATRGALDVPIVLGGAGPTLSPELFLKNAKADFCVIGEGEETLPEILESIDEPKAVKGIAYKDGEGRVALTEPRPYVKDLDSLPFPDYGVFDMAPYLRSVKVKQRSEPAHTVITSRGCPYSCAFCSLTFEGARFRSAEHVLAEIDHLRRLFGKGHVAFADELLTVPRRRVEDIAAGLAERQLIWNCQGRINLLDRSLLAYLWQTGCRTIGYGVESGCDRILKAMNKKITREQIKEVISWTVAQGYDILLQLIFGFPGEDDESLAETQNLLQELKLPASFAVMTPLPGSPVYKDLLAGGIIGDEDAYLESISRGYLHHGKVKLNLTRWSDEEFHARKKRIEREINVASQTGTYAKTKNPKYVKLFVKRYGFRPWVKEFAIWTALKLKHMTIEKAFPPRQG